MAKDPKQFLIDILDVVGYEKDRSQFASEFLSLCYQQALVDLMAEMPVEAQASLIRKLAKFVDYDNLKSILSEYFPKNKYDEAVENATETVFGEYLDSIIPKLTAHQKEKLNQYLTTLSA